MPIFQMKILRLTDADLCKVTHRAMRVGTRKQSGARTLTGL